MQFIARTRNENYKGKACGIAFDHGKALIDTQVIDPRVGLGPLAAAIRLQNDFGYAIEPLDDEARKAFEAFERQSKTKAKQS